MHCTAGPITIVVATMPGSPVAACDDTKPLRPHRDLLSVYADEVRVADEARDPLRRRRVVDLARRADLLDVAAVHHDDAIGHRERLLLVVRDVDERDADLLLDPLQLDLQLLAHLEVERAERLVEEQDARVHHERTCERDALLLAARELARLPLPRGPRAERATSISVARARRSVRPRPRCFSPYATLSSTVRCGKSAYDWNTVLTSRLYGGTRETSCAADPHLALVGPLEPGDEPQRRRLPAAGRTEQREELARDAPRGRSRRRPRASRSASSRRRARRPAPPSPRPAALSSWVD